MLFNTIQFGLFFAIVLGLYSVFAHRRQNTMLLVASYIFYGAWDWRFLSLIAISTLIDFYCGLQIERADSQYARRRFLILSLVSNLGILGFFKYFNFFADNAAAILGAMGLHASPFMLSIVLPVGVSFYTFQTLSYTIDVYRRQMPACRSFSDFALFVAFFPQLVAGPIERASELLPAIQQPRRQTVAGMQEGFHLILWGLYKKVLIADNLSLSVDRWFAQGTMSATDVVLGTLFFAIQIYCDFSGYTDIARGVARTMGFQLMVNFDLPYFATSPQDFWRRWHISLSTWLRDYLYISLGGNRKGTGRTYLNLIVTMVLGGLWHGASWTFVIWGLFHGLLLAGHRWFAQACPLFVRRIPGIAAWALMLMLTMYGWLIFRATDVHQLWQMTTALTTGPYELRPLIGGLAKLGFYSWLLILVQIAQYRTGDAMVITRIPWPLQSLFYLVCLYSIVILGKYDTESFIYFQF